MDAKTKEIRERQTGVTEKKHRLQQMLRSTFGVAGITLAIAAVGARETSHDGLLAKYGGYAGGALIAVSYMKMESASRLRRNRTSWSLIDSALGDDDPTGREFDAVIADLSHLQKHRQLGSAKMEAVALIREFSDPKAEQSAKC